MKTEFILSRIESGRRVARQEFKSLKDAHVFARDNWGHTSQVTFEEAESVNHAHIMEFRDDEIHNDIYLI